jgi:hypothetical protein
MRTSQTARKVSSSPSSPLSRRALPPAPTPSAQREARRRLQRIRRRRLDLLQDVAMAVALTLFTLISTAGLGVVALLCLAAGLFLGATLAAERYIR